MLITPGTAWGLITARGGSKSIPLKNIFPVCGRPLVEYVGLAGMRATRLSKVVCSTDHPAIAAAVAPLGVEVVDRPAALGGDDVNTIDVMLEFVATAGERGPLPEVIVLLQPTSLFVTSDQIDAVASALLADPAAKSAQTVVRVPHQFHAHNQREMSADGRDVWFVFERERARGYNKQTKPAFFSYGNLIATKTASLIADRTIFGRPSIPIEIPLPTAYDLDGPEDVAMAELMITNGLVPGACE